MTTINLTPAQRAILAKIINTNSGKIDWFPDNIKGGAYKKVLDRIFGHAPTTNDGTDWFVIVKGYDALGMKRPDVTPPIPEAGTELEYAMVTTEAMRTPVPAQAKPHTRDNSKQAEVIRILQRPGGVTIGQIYITTGWQVHTMRGIFTGTFKKKLGLTIVSDKPQGGEWVYCITWSERSGKRPSGVWLLNRTVRYCGYRSGHPERARDEHHHADPRHPE